MPLTLTITSYQRLSPGQEATKSIDRCDITIGRAPDNDWPLPDPERFLSSHHCVIQYRGGAYYLTDTSTNGVFVNHSDERVPKGQSVRLNDGDCLTLGEYEMQVGLEKQAPAADWQTLPGGRDYLDPDPAVTPVGPPTEDELFSNTQPTGQSPVPDFGRPDEASLLSGSAGNDDLLGPSPQPPRQAPEPPPPQSGGTFEPPQIPEDFDLEWGLTPSEPARPVPPVGQGPARPPVTPEPPPARPAPPPRSSQPDSGSMAPKPPPARPAPPPRPPQPDFGSAAPEAPGARPVPPGAPLPSSAAGGRAKGDPLAAFLRGSGLESLPLADDDGERLMELVGLIFRQMVQGLMEILMARNQIKGEFRLSQTAIRPVENNPLKFSVGLDEAMTNLLTPRGSAYMPAQQAVREGFDDIRAHQLAVMAGMQTALNDLLRRFNPEALEERLGHHCGVTGILPGMRKARYWDLFKVIYGEIAEEAQENFQEHFGREFARAYEEQIQAFKSSRRP